MIYKLKEDLESKGYQVFPALAYGFTWGIKKPKDVHSTYLIHLNRTGMWDVNSLIRFGRLATTVGKSVLIAIPLKDDQFRYYELRGWNNE